jgi:hypothetical protein
MSRGAALALLGVALVVAAIVAALADPTVGQVEPEPWPWPSAFAALGALGLLSGAWLERRALRRALAARQARFGGLAAAYAAVVLVALGALGFLAERHAVRLDLTRDRIASLDEDTRRVLRAIPSEGPPVEVFGFVAGASLEAIDSAAAAGELQPLFRLLTRESPLVRARLADAAREPALARALGIASVPSVAVRWTPPGEEEARVVRTDLLDEVEVARAIEQALVGELRVAYVVSGHGEMSPIDIQGSGGLFRAMMAVAGDNYDVRPLALVEAGAIPADAALVVIAGPQTDLLPAEVEALRSHVAAGGRLLLLLGPAFGPDGRVAAMPALAGWLEDGFGLELEAAVVADLEGLTGPAADVRALVVPPAEKAPHPIVRGRDRILLMPFNRPLRLAPALPHGSAGEVLLRSSTRSWAERDTPVQPSFDPADRRGPHDLAVALTFKPWDQEREARLVVFGSHLFAANAHFTIAGNASLLLDAVAWLNEREACSTPSPGSTSARTCSRPGGSAAGTARRSSPPARASSSSSAPPPSPSSSPPSAP